MDGQTDRYYPLEACLCYNEIRNRKGVDLHRRGGGEELGVGKPQLEYNITYENITYPFSIKGK